MEGGSLSKVIVWIRPIVCPECLCKYTGTNLLICQGCGNKIPIYPVREAPSGRYLMNFCTCKKEPLVTRDPDGHLHLKLLKVDAFLTLNAGEV